MGVDNIENKSINDGIDSLQNKQNKNLLYDLDAKPDYSEFVEISRYIEDILIENFYKESSIYKDGLINIQDGGKDAYKKFLGKLNKELTFISYSKKLNKEKINLLVKKSVDLFMEYDKKINTSGLPGESIIGFVSDEEFDIVVAKLSTYAIEI